MGRNTIHYTRLCEFGIKQLCWKEIAVFAFHAGLFVYFASSASGSNNRGRTPSSHPLPSLQPIVLLVGSCTVVMDVHCTWNLSILSSQRLLYQMAYTYLLSIWDYCVLVWAYAYVCILWEALAMQGRGWIECCFKLSCSHLSLLLFTDAL